MNSFLLVLTRSTAITFLIISNILVMPLIASDESAGISGKVYYDWSYDADEAADGYNEFALSRLYFGYKKHLSEAMELTLNTDILNDGTAWVSYQKYAYLSYDMGVGKAVIGLQGMNFFNIAEGNWGYRYVAKSSMDGHHFASSADMGVGYVGIVANMVYLHLTATNGAGYKHVEDDKYKKLAAQAYVGQKALSSNPGYNAGASFSYEPYEFAPDTTESISAFSLFGAFATKSLRLGGEFDREMDSEEHGHTRQIIAAYADYHISAFHKAHVNAFGRVEIYDHDTDEDGDEMSLLLGLSISPIKKVHVAPVIEISELESGDTGLSAFRLNFEFKF